MSPHLGTEHLTQRPRGNSILHRVHQDPVSENANSEFPNVATSWVNAKGAWFIHLFLVICAKIIFDTIPGMTQQLSWTFTNLVYTVGSYAMFHSVSGGAAEHLTLWENIDEGDQYTPARKFLLVFPIVLFLTSTHYTQYDLIYFIINLVATLSVVIPKLPWSHRLRLSLLVPPEDP